MSPDADPAEDGAIRLVLPSDAEFVAVARFVAGFIATQADFTLEEVEDLRLAVDELFTSGGGLDNSHSSALWTFRHHRQESDLLITMAAQPSGKRDSESPHYELSQQLLAALVDDHGEGADDNGGRYLWLRKSRRSG